MSGIVLVQQTQLNYVNMCENKLVEQEVCVRICKIMFQCLKETTNYVFGGGGFGGGYIPLENFSFIWRCNKLSKISAFVLCENEGLDSYLQK